MLTKRIAISIALGLVAASPVAAAAATGGDASRARTGDAVAGGATLEGARPLERPGNRLERTIRAHLPRIRAQRRAERREAREQREQAFAALPGGVSQSTLDSIAACESGGDPTIVSAGGTYRGKYQFSYSTWASVGGSGDPAAAPEAEQDYRAALLYSRSGSSPWPICG